MSASGESETVHPAQADAAATTPPRQRRAARLKVVRGTAEGYFDAFSARDTDRMLGYWHSDGIADVVPVGISRGRAAIEADLDELLHAVPDLDVAIGSVSVDRDRATVQWRRRGAFIGGDLQGLRATGNRIDLRGVDLLEIDADGLITRSTTYYDGVEFARSIGMLPSGGSNGDRVLRSATNGLTKLRRTIGGLR